ncbi:MAG: glycosyltransferase family 2 protein, partial [Desulfonatronovibrionaceae bacterium]
SARNLGLELARGSLAAFLDSDDCWLPEKLELQARFMSEAGFRISQTEEIWIRHGKRVNPMRKHAKPGGWIFEKSLDLCLVSPSCVVMDMDLVREGYVFDADFSACEDYDLWLRISLKHPVGLVPRALTVRYGGRGDQLSGMITGQDLFRIYSLLKLEKTPDLDPGQRQSLERVLLKKAGVYIRGCLKRGRQEEAARIKNLLQGRI